MAALDEGNAEKREKIFLATRVIGHTLCLDRVNELVHCVQTGTIT